jgi:hypothetical protein
MPHPDEPDPVRASSGQQGESPDHLGQGTRAFARFFALDLMYLLFLNSDLPLAAETRRIDLYRHGVTPRVSHSI